MSTVPVSFSGLVSGLNTQSIISAEMAIFEMPLKRMQAQQATVNTQISDYQTINSQLLTLQQAADTLSSPVAYGQAFSTTSSNSAIATATVTGATQTGSVTLAVDQLATASTQISSGTVASPNVVVASGSLLLGTGGGALGITGFAGTSGLASGAHTLTVTQASSGATATGSGAVASSTTITSSNDQLDVTVNGTAQTLTLATGTYTASQLAKVVAQASGGTLTASVDGNGVLSLATTQQGSSATLAVTGGSALAALGLSAGATTTGTDGIVNLDGTSTTVSDIAGSGTTTVTLASGTGGTVNATLSGGLTLGTTRATSLSVGNGSLSAVVSAINQAGLGVTANALRVGTTSYALELTSNGTGTAAATTVDTQAFATSGLGALTTTVAAQNAVVSIGGTGGYQVTSQGNTITGLLPGVTVNVAQASSSPVTLTVSPDGSQVVDQVQTLVDAANQVLSTISSDTAYDSQTKVAAPLNGSAALSQLTQRILSAVGGAVGKSAAGSDGTAGESAGLAITSSGTITFNKAAFEAAYDKDPAGVQAMFTEGGTFSPSGPAYAGTVTVAGATDDTVPGSYAVTVSRSASQATDTGSAVWAATTSTLAQAETYTITSGSATATYAATAGETIAGVVSGMNAALATAGIGTSAAVTGSAGAYKVQLVSATYGSAASFSVATSGTDQLGLTTSGASYAGTDVAGTIDGQAALGSGQDLSLEDPSNPANGIVLQVATQGITSSTSLGTVAYSPGLAQGLGQVSKSSSLAPNGIIPLTIAGLHGTVSMLNSEIAMQQELVATQQAALTSEFTALEATLSKLQSESQFLSQSASSASGSSSSSSSSLGSASTSSTGL